MKKIAAAMAIILALSGTGAANANEEQCILKPEYQEYCVEAGEEFGICPEILMAIAERESHGDPNAIGKAGDTGLMQIIEKYHTDRMEVLGVRDLKDPQGNIRVAADYLSDLSQKYEDIGTVLMIYNGVSGAKQKGEAGEYTDYALDVLARSEQLERMDGK